MSNQYVWIAYDEDLSHGIQRIIGVYKTLEAAIRDAERYAEHQPQYDGYAVRD